VSTPEQEIGNPEFRGKERTVSLVAEVFEEYRERLVARAQRILRSETEADDVVQEVMLGIMEAPDILPTVESMIGWLYTLVRRRCVDLVRSDRSRKAREENAGIEALLNGTPDANELMDDAEVIEAVAVAVDALPAPQRHAFVANVLDGKTFREISAETGEPMGTLMARKKRAVDAIRVRLQEQGIIQS